MTNELVFIGDVHGCIYTLDKLLDILNQRGFAHAVFMGDYVNKGPDSNGVLERLSILSEETRFTFLRGNHEALMMQALLGNEFGPFLKAGGASTVRSYLQAPIAATALEQFRSAVPAHHVEFLRSTQSDYRTDEIWAQHQLPPTLGELFRVGGHINVGKIPKIGTNYALIDTGCGTTDGRLTAFSWPSLRIDQVKCGI